jgi:uncharacterized protein HemX
MTWLADHLKAVLTVVAAIGLVLGGARWVWSAEGEHQKARSVAELVKQNAEIIQKQQQQLETDEALAQQREKIRECLQENPNAPERCVH